MRELKQRLCGNLKVLANGAAFLLVGRPALAGTTCTSGMLNTLIGTTCDIGLLRQRLARHANLCRSSHSPPSSGIP
ncbi:MAG: hypothetical protein ACLQOO_31825 [Terriglobia bacterium]